MKTHKNISKTFGALLAVVCLAYAFPAQAAMTFFDFEAGTDLWTISSGFAQSSAKTGENGTFGLVSNFPDTGTATSPGFVIDEELLKFKVGGYGRSSTVATTSGVGGIKGQMPYSNQDQRWQLIRTSDSAVLSQGTAPFQNSFQEYTVDTSKYIGTSVKLEFTDTNAGPDPFWVGVDFVRSVDRDATSVLTSELPEQSGWTLTGTTYEFVAAAGPEFGIGNTQPRDGGEWIRGYGSSSNSPGITAPSSAKSPTFQLTRETLEANTAGFGGDHINTGGNGRVGDTHIYLRNASDDSLLYTFGVSGVPLLPTTTSTLFFLGGDSWQHHTVDVSSLAGLEVYIELTDTDISSGLSWSGIDDVFLTGAVTFVAVPEPNTFVLGALGLVGLGLVARRRRRRESGLGSELH